MALSADYAKNSVTVSSATQSDHIQLASGVEYILEFTSAGAFVLDLQMAGDPSQTFRDVYWNPTTKVTIDSAAAAPMHVKVDGGMCYRMDVSTYNNPITMKAYEVKIS